MRKTENANYVNTYFILFYDAEQTQPPYFNFN